MHKGSQEQWQVELGTISVNKARSKHIDQLFLKTKTDHSDFQKHYQNLHKVRKTTNQSQKRTISYPSFESQNRLDPKKQRFLKTFGKIRREEGNNGHPHRISTRRVLLLKPYPYQRNQLLETSNNRQQTQKEVNRFEVIVDK